MYHTKFKIVGTEFWASFKTLIGIFGAHSGCSKITKMLKRGSLMLLVPYKIRSAGNTVARRGLAGALWSLLAIRGSQGASTGSKNSPPRARGSKARHTNGGAPPSARALRAVVRGHRNNCMKRAKRTCYCFVVLYFGAFL